MASILCIHCFKVDANLFKKESNIIGSRLKQKKREKRNVRNGQVKAKSKHANTYNKASASTDKNDIWTGSDELDECESLGGNMGSMTDIPKGREARHDEDGSGDAYTGYGEGRGTEGVYYGASLAFGAESFWGELSA